MKLTPAKIDRLEVMALALPVVFLAPGTLRDLLEERRILRREIAHLEQPLQDAEGDARRFCGLAGAAIRGEAVAEG